MTSKQSHTTSAVINSNLGKNVAVDGHVGTKRPYPGDLGNDLLLDSDEPEYRPIDKNLKVLFKSHMAAMNMRFPGDTMTNVNANFELPPEQILNFMETRPNVYKHVPILYPSNEVAEIRNMIILFADYLKQAGVYELLHYHVMNHLVN